MGGVGCGCEWSGVDGRRDIYLRDVQRIHRHKQREFCVLNAEKKPFAKISVSDIFTIDVNAFRIQPNTHPSIQQ